MFSHIKHVMSPYNYTDNFLLDDILRKTSVSVNILTLDSPSFKANEGT